jgi:hypothetical protein
MAVVKYKMGTGMKLKDKWVLPAPRVTGSLCDWVPRLVTKEAQSRVYFEIDSQFPVDGEGSPFKATKAERWVAKAGLVYICDTRDEAFHAIAIAKELHAAIGRVSKSLSELADSNILKI